MDFATRRTDPASNIRIKTMKLIASPKVRGTLDWVIKQFDAQAKAGDVVEIEPADGSVKARAAFEKFAQFVKDCETIDGAMFDHPGKRVLEARVNDCPWLIEFVYHPSGQPSASFSLVESNPTRKGP